MLGGALVFSRGSKSERHLRKKNKSGSHTLGGHRPSELAALKKILRSPSPSRRDCGMILSCGACLGAAVLRVLASAIPFSSSRSRVACEGEAWASMLKYSHRGGRPNIAARFPFDTRTSTVNKVVRGWLLPLQCTLQGLVTDVHFQCHSKEVSLSL